MNTTKVILTLRNPLNEQETHDLYILPKEADIGKKWISKLKTCLQDNYKIEKNYQVTGRFGKAVGNDLIYIKAGISFADVKFDVTDEVNNPVSGNRYGSKWFHGGLVGLGLDHKFNDNLIFGAEFNHISYASENISATGTSSAGLALKEIYSPKSFHSENVIFNLRYLF